MMDRVVSIYLISTTAFDFRKAIGEIDDRVWRSSPTFSVWTRWTTMVDHASRPRDLDRGSSLGTVAKYYDLAAFVPEIR